jgi:hypothetical protein
MPSHPVFDPERLARIEQMIDAYRATKERRSMQRAMREWENAEAHQTLVDLDKPPVRVH